MKKAYLLECCVDSFASARAAKEGGADRLELCTGLVIGGLTPSVALLEEIKNRLDIRVHVLLRPRFGDFLYTEDEAAILCKEIKLFKAAGADGIVVGSLTPDGSLNTEQMKRFLDCVGELPVTLHRAFDMCKDPYLALEQAKRLGVSTILTSGQAPSSLAGLSLLKELAQAAGEELTILAGGGIDEASVRTLLEQTELTAFHMSGKKVVESGMTYRNPAVSMGLPGVSEYEIWQTDEKNVRAVKKLLMSDSL